MQKNMSLQQFGIIERPRYTFEGYSAAGYTVITTGLKDSNTKSDVFAALKNPKNYEKDITNLLRIRAIQSSQKLSRRC